MKRHYETSNRLRKAVLADGGPKCLLSFSAGKDALCAWFALRDSGFEVIPFYLYVVPDLEFVEQGLRYYEDFFKTPIARYPHASYSRMMTNLVFQPPERAAIIEKMQWPAIGFTHVEQHMREEHNAPEAYVALGTRAADSLGRHTNIARYGAMTPSRRSFLPIFDWTVSDIRETLAKHKVKLTVDYDLFGRSLDGIDYRFLEPISRHYPRDYERILEAFPLAHLELTRRTLRGAP